MAGVGLMSASGRSSAAEQMDTTARLFALPFHFIELVFSCVFESLSPAPFGSPPPSPSSSKATPPTQNKSLGPTDPYKFMFLFGCAAHRQVN